ncbi:MAG: glycosyltransferase family 2 protein [Thalassococcus sp.]|uniref:glycosyltransferase family 2 protein n=1 Tax=Thalassococcus sp. TaxID=1928858 RepID=UPI001B2DD459|nr:glycosyltransferase family 2 protein [Thalassococcus sp.]MBO6865852.1 glycosyltransferase family 2 protein [Thalassococcus sp.]
MGESDVQGISVIIPAHNEAAVIGRCLASVLASDPVPFLQVVVVANGCTDDTARVAQSYNDQFAENGWELSVLDLPVGGKPNALNAGDAAARFGTRVYLDADVTLSKTVLPELAGLLAVDAPVYASGRLNIVAPDNFASRAYARIWRKVPFMAQGVPGCGLFAVNTAGRARWGAFPDIISDDTFVRLHFAADERVSTSGSYDWPVVTGLRNLIKVRARQDRGVEEVRTLYPDLIKNEDTPATDIGEKLKLALADPIGFATYTGVALAVKFGPKGDSGWSRGR